LLKKQNIKYHVLMLVLKTTLSEKRYKGCHLGCTFSKGKLLSILGANMDI